MKQFYFLRFTGITGVLLLTFFISLNKANAQTTLQSTTKYVRVDIGHGGLHCPFLGPEFEKKVKQMGNVNNYKANIQQSYATFELPATIPVSSEEIRQVAIKVGYPDADVSVVISDTAPVNQQ